MTCKDKVSRMEGGWEDGRMEDWRKRLSESHRKVGGIWCQIKAE